MPELLDENSEDLSGEMILILTRLPRDAGLERLLSLYEDLYELDVSYIISSASSYGT